MNRFYQYLLCSLLLLSAGKSAVAQVYVGRNFFATPLDDTTREATFLNTLAFSAEGSRGFGSALGEQAWNIKYVGLVELYRWSHRAAIGGTLSHELTANPHNDINFHMRGAIWNESLAFYRKLAASGLELGITHHCRHEIDNSIPADEFADTTAHYVPTRRLIVMTSPYVAFYTDWKPVASAGMVYRLFSRANVYTYHQDGRRPRSYGSEQSWENIRASVLLGGRLQAAVQDKLHAYVRAWVNPVYFIRDAPLKVNFRAEGGMELSGKQGFMAFFGAYEHFFDDVSRPYPLSSDVFYVGIRGRSGLFF